MRFKSLDLNLLVALDVMLDEKNITRAAERLHITQSAASGILGRLRDYFKDDLLIYVDRKMQPTPFALQLEAPVRDVLLRVQALMAPKEDFNPLLSDRKFKIIASDYIVSVLLSKVMAWASTHAPGVKFEIVGVSDQINEMLNRGEVDLLIMPDIYSPGEQPSTLLLEEDHACVVWDGNTEVGDAITLEQYLKMGHICVGFGRSGKRSIEDWLISQFGVERRIEVICNDFNTLSQVVVGTNRVVTTHRSLAELYAKYLPLRILNPPVNMPKTRMDMVWHKSKEGDIALHWLRERIVDMAKAHSQPA